jgi:hypothetical protein
MFKRSYQEMLNTITLWLEATLTLNQTALIPIKVQTDEPQNCAPLRTR